MDIILVHIGSKIPEFSMDCVSQIRGNTKDRILLYAPNHSGRPLGVLSKEVTFIKNLREPPTWKSFKKDKPLITIGAEGFWRYTCERLFAVEAIMKEYSVDKALHIENDNLIYYPPDYEQLDADCGQSVGMTRINDTMISAGIMYVGSIEAIEFINRRLVELLNLGEKKLLEMTCEVMVNEMMLLGYIKKKNNDSITLLPTIPRINDKSKYIYDCASWGQYVGGTHQNPGTPFAHDSHTIGLAINSNMLDLKWVNGKPIAVNKSDKSEKPLYNLHIHSKELSKWR